MKKDIGKLIFLVCGRNPVSIGTTNQKTSINDVFYNGQRIMVSIKGADDSTHMRVCAHRDKPAI